jgi:hypothetical protein
MEEVLTRKQVGNQFVYDKTTKDNWELNKGYRSAEGWHLVPVEHMIPVEVKEEPKEEPKEQVSTKKKDKKEPVKTILLEGIEQEVETSSPEEL